MKRSLIAVCVFVSLFIFAQTYQIKIVVKGDLPGDTNTNNFQNGIIANTADNFTDSTYTFYILEIASDDTTIKRARIDIQGTLAEDKNPLTFAGQVFNYFNNPARFQSGWCRYTMEVDSTW